jgi:hypothetical protein
VVGEVLRDGMVLEDGSAGCFCGRRSWSAWRRFLATTTAHGSSRALPGVVPVLEVKAHSRMTLRGARGWLLRRLRRGGAALGRGAW